MAIRNIHNTLKTSLLNYDPYSVVHLIKFERPRNVNQPSGTIKGSSLDYAYMTDAQYDISYQDGSIPVGSSTPNPAQTYRANKVINLGTVNENIRAKASNLNLTLDAASLGTSLNVSCSFVSGTCTTDGNLPEAGFQEGDKIYLETVTGTNDGKYVIIDRFTNGGTVFKYTAISSITEQAAAQATSATYTISQSSEEVVTLVANSNSYTNYINREVIIYRAHINPESREIIGEPFLYFKGITSKASISEGLEKSTITWGLSSHWGDFLKVTGRITEDSEHRALGLDGTPDIDSLVRSEYANDYGFLHSTAAVNLAATYNEFETRYREEDRTGPDWATGTRTVEYQEEVTRELNLAFNPQAKMLPVVYGVRKVDSFPIFIDVDADDSGIVYKADAICEGPISSIMDLDLDGTSLICIDEADYSIRNSSGSQYVASAVDIPCFGRADSGGVLDDYQAATGAYYDDDVDRFVTRLVGVFFPSVTLSKWQQVSFNTADTGSDTGIGINHEKSHTFLSPIRGNITFHAGEANQKSDNLLTWKSNTNKFKIQSDFYDNDKIPYWSTSHRLLDTAYVTGEYHIASGQTDIPNIKYVVRGRDPECYNYDGTYTKDDTVSSISADNFDVGDEVTLHKTSNNDQIGTTVKIIDKFSLKPRSFGNVSAFETNLSTRFIFSTTPDLGTTTRFYMKSVSTTSHKYYFSTWDDTAASGDIQATLSATITSGMIASGTTAGLKINLDAATDSDLETALVHDSAIIGFVSDDIPSILASSYADTDTSLVGGSVVIDNITSYTTTSRPDLDEVVLKNAIQIESGLTSDEIVGSKVIVTEVINDVPRVQERTAIAFISSSNIVFVDSPWDYDSIPSDACTYKIGFKGDKRVTINPAMQLLDYMTNTRYGKGLSLEKEIDLDYWKAAAGVCDTRSTQTLIVSNTTDIDDDDIGTVYTYKPNDVTLWRGKLKSIESAPQKLQLTFEECYRKIAYKSGRGRVFQDDEYYWSNGTLYKHTGTAGIATATNPLSTTEVKIYKEDSTDSGPSNLVLDYTTGDFNGNPIVKKYSNSSQSFSDSGYSLYDSDDVKYWKYLGWDFPSQRNVTRHQLNQIVYTTNSVFSNINNMLQQFNGILRYSAGKYQLDIKGTNPGVTSAGRISEDDIIGTISLDDSGIKGSINSISANIVDPAAKFESRSISFFNSDYLKQDNGIKKSGNFKLSGITNYYNARLNIKQYLDESRFGVTIKFKMAPRGLMLLSGSIIELTYPRFGFDNKEFRIENLNFTKDGTVDVVAREHNDSAYLVESVQGFKGISASVEAGQGSAPRSIPNRPTALSATQVQQGEIILSWTNSSQFSSASHLVEIYSNTVNNFENVNTTLIGTSSSDTYHDILSVGGGVGVGNTTRYYWIRYQVKTPRLNGASTELINIPSEYFPNTTDTNHTNGEGIAGTGSTSNPLRAIKLNPGTTGSFVYQTDGTGIESGYDSTTTLTTTRTNISGTESFVWKLGGNVISGEDEANYDYTPPTNFSDMPQVITVQVTDTVGSDTYTAEDSITITASRIIDEGVVGTDGFTITAQNSTHVFRTDSDGDITDFASFQAGINVVKGDTTFGFDTSVSPTANTYKYGTIAYENSDHITVNVLQTSGNEGDITISSSAGTFRTGTSVTRTSFVIPVIDNNTGDTIASIKYSLSKTLDGAAGVKTALVYAYQRSSTTLTTNPGAVDVNLNTGQISTASLANGWQKDIADTSGTDDLYICAASASGTGNSDSIAAGEWSSAVTLAVHGSHGSDAKTVIVSPDAYFFVKGKNGNLTPGSINVTANNQNLTADGTWTTSAGTISEQTDTHTAAVCEIDSDDFVDGMVITYTAASADGSLSDSVTLKELEAGSDAIQGILSNPAHTLHADSDGVVSSTTGSGTTIRVFEGATELSFTTSSPTDGKFNVAVSDVTGITEGGVTDSGSFCTIGDHSSVDSNTDSFVITYTISGKSSNGESFTTFTLDQTITKVKDGTDAAELTITGTSDSTDSSTGVTTTTITFSDNSTVDIDHGTDGTNARTVEINSEKLAFTYDSDGDADANQTAVVTATPRNTSGTVFYEFFIDGTAQGSGPASGTDADEFTYTPPTSFANMPQTIKVEIREGAADGAIVATDTVQTFGLQDSVDGTSPYSVIVTNPSHVFPASTAGVVTTYNASATNIQVFKGTTELNSVAESATPGAGEFNISSITATNITVSETREVSPTHLYTSNHSAFDDDEDIAAIVYNLDVEGSETLQGWQTFTKSKKGDTGDVGKSTIVVADSNFFVKAEDGTLTPETITITANNMNTTADGAWSVSSGHTLTSTTNTHTAASCTVSRDDFTDGMVVTYTTASADNSVSDSVTLKQLDEGSRAVTGILSNETHIVPTGIDGVVTTSALAGSGTTIKVFEGATELAFTTGTPAAGEFAISATSSDIDTVGDITDSGTFATIGNLPRLKEQFGDANIADTLDNWTVVYTISGKNQRGESFTSFDLVQSFTKTKRGETGPDGIIPEQLVITANKYVFPYSNTGVLLNEDGTVHEDNDSDADVTLYINGNIIRRSGKYKVKLYINGTYYAGSTYGDGVSYQSGDQNSDNIPQITIGIDDLALSYSDMPLQVRVDIHDYDPNSNDDPVLATDSLVVYGAKEGHDAYTVVLDNPTATLISNSNGVVSDFTETGTDIQVYKGTTKLIRYKSTDGAVDGGSFADNADSRFNVTSVSYSDSDIDGTIGSAFGHNDADEFDDTKWVVGDITGWPNNENRGYREFTISAENVQTLKIRQNLNRVKQPEDAVEIYVIDTTTTEYAFNYDKEGNKIGTPTVTVKAAIRDNHASSYQLGWWKWQVFDADDDVVATSTGLTSSTDGWYVNTSFTSNYAETMTYTPPADIADMPQKVRWSFISDDVQSYNSAVFASPDARDEVHFIGVRDGLSGEDSVFGVLTNPTHTFTSEYVNSQNYDVEDYDGSETSILIFRGTTPLSYGGNSNARNNETDKTNKYYIDSVTETNIEQFATNFTTETINDVTVARSREADNFASNEDQASLAFVVHAYITNAEYIEIPLEQTFSKAKNGQDGGTAKLALISSNTSYFTRHKDGTLSPDSVQLSARTFNIQRTNESWTSVGVTNDILQVDSDNFTVSTGGNKYLTFTKENMEDHLADIAQLTISSVRDVARFKYYSGSPDLKSDEFDIGILEEGKDSITVELTNATHAIETTREGKVKDYDNSVGLVSSGTKIRMYQGATKFTIEDTYNDMTPGTFRFLASSQPTPNGILNYVSNSGSSYGTDELIIDDLHLQSPYTQDWQDSKVTYTLSYMDLEGNRGSTSAEQTITGLSEGIQGDKGSNVRITGGKAVVNYNKNGSSPDPGNQGFTAVVSSPPATGSLAYRWYFNGTAAGPGANGWVAGTLDSDANEQYFGMSSTFTGGNGRAGDVVKVEVKHVPTGSDLDDITDVFLVDEFTIGRLREGEQKGILTLYAESDSPSNYLTDISLDGGKYVNFYEYSGTQPSYLTPSTLADLNFFRVGGSGYKALYSTVEEPTQWSQISFTPQKYVHFFEYTEDSFTNLTDSQVDALVFVQAEADALEVTGSSVVGDNTVITFSAGPNVSIANPSDGDTKGVKVLYADSSDPQTWAAVSLTDGDYVNFYEYTDSFSTLTNLQVQALTFTPTVGVAEDAAGVTPIYSTSATGDDEIIGDSDDLTANHTYINFYEWTGSAPTTVPSDLTYIEYVGEDATPLTVTGSSVVGNNTVITFSAGSNVSVPNGTDGTTIGVKALYSNIADPQTQSDINTTSGDFVNFYEFTGTYSTPSNTVIANDLDFVPRTSNNIVPLFAEVQSPTAFSQISLTSGKFVHFHEFTGTYSNPSDTDVAGMTFVQVEGDDAAPLTVTGSSQSGDNTVITFSDNESVNVPNGADGLNSATVFIYEWTSTSSNTTNNPPGNTTYTFSSGAVSFSGTTTWESSPPDAGDNDLYLWYKTATASSTGTTATIANNAWSSVGLLSVIPANGTRGSGVFTFEQGDSTIATNTVDSFTGDTFGTSTATLAMGQVANAVIDAAVDGFIRPNDKITLFDPSNNLAGTRIYTGTATSTYTAATSWSSLVVETIDGSLIVDGTLSADTISSDDALTNTLTVEGGIKLSSTGKIFTAAKLSYGASDSGIFFQNTSDGTRLDIGDGNKHLRWDGSSLTIKGDLKGGGLTSASTPTDSSKGFFFGQDGTAFIGNKDKYLSVDVDGRAFITSLTVKDLTSDISEVMRLYGHADVETGDADGYVDPTDDKIAYFPQPSFDSDDVSSTPTANVTLSVRQHRKIDVTDLYLEMKERFPLTGGRNVRVGKIINLVTGTFDSPGFIVIDHRYASPVNGSGISGYSYPVANEEIDSAFLTELDNTYEVNNGDKLREVGSTTTYTVRKAFHGGTSLETIVYFNQTNPPSSWAIDDYVEVFEAATSTEIWETVDQKRFFKQDHDSDADQSMLYHQISLAGTLGRRTNKQVDVRLKWVTTDDSQDHTTDDGNGNRNAIESIGGYYTKVR